MIIFPFKDNVGKSMPFEANLGLVKWKALVKKPLSKSSITLDALYKLYVEMEESLKNRAVVDVFQELT